jgi:hypothetical protein
LALKPLKTARLDGASFFYVDILVFGVFLFYFLRFILRIFKRGSFLSERFRGAISSFFFLFRAFSRRRRVRFCASRRRRNGVGRKICVGRRRFFRSTRFFAPRRLRREKRI